MNNKTFLIFEEIDGLYYWTKNPERKPLTPADIKALEILDPSLILLIIVPPIYKENENTDSGKHE